MKLYREEILEMDAEQLRVEIAKAKYERVEVRGCEFSPDCGDLSEVQDIGRRYSEDRSTRDNYILWPCWLEDSFTDDGVIYEYWRPVPDWPISIADAYELEGEVPPEEIENYMRELGYVINHKLDFAVKWLYQIAHATPEQRSRAWLIWKTEAE